MLTHLQTFLKEIKEEAATTRKMLKLVPEDKYDWKPHQKSMSMIQLATHIAEIPGWAAMALNTPGLDFNAGTYVPTVVDNNAALLEIFEKSLAESIERLENAQEEELDGSWIMRSGDHILVSLTKGETIRHSLNQTTHHRAQLGVYLRLLDIPIPGSYGPSADDANF